MKKCLILGGGSDIGAATITALAQEFEIVWTFFATNRSDLPGKSIRCDLRDIGQVSELLNQIDSLDLLVTSSFPFLESANLDFDGYIQSERFLRSHVLILTEVGKKMNGGKIINILGQCVERGLPGAAFYSASFAFLHNYGNSVNGREGKAGKVSICDLLLGPVDTREWSGLSEEVVFRYRTKVAQFISPRQVAETVAFLARQEVMPSTFKLDAYYGY